MTPEERAYQHGKLKAKVGGKPPTFGPYTDRKLAREFVAGWKSVRQREPVEYRLPAGTP